MIRDGEVRRDVMSSLSITSANKDKIFQFVLAPTFGGSLTYKYLQLYAEMRS